MPIKTKKSLSDDLTEHIVTGVVTDKEMSNCENEFYDSGPTKLQLWDLSDAILTKITIEGMRQFVTRSAKLGEIRSGGRTAIVVQSQLQYGLGRVAESFGEFESLPFSFRMFKNRSESIKWLTCSIQDEK